MNNRELKYLGLSNLNLTDGASNEQIQLAFNKVGQLLATNQTLSSLDISGNNIYDIGATCIFKGLC